MVRVFWHTLYLNVEFATKPSSHGKGSRLRHSFWVSCSSLLRSVRFPYSCETHALGLTANTYNTFPRDSSFGIIYNHERNKVKSSTRFHDVKCFECTPLKRAGQASSSSQECDRRLMRPPSRILSPHQELVMDLPRISNAACCEPTPRHHRELLRSASPSSPYRTVPLA